MYQNLFNLLLLTIAFGVFYYTYNRARSGHLFYIRDLPALRGFEEAVNRAVEMGRPVFMGLGSFGATPSGAALAALSMFSHLSHLCAEKGAQAVIHVLGSGAGIPIIEEARHQASVLAGKPENEKLQEIVQLPSSGWGYSAHWTSDIVRRQGASAFLLGHYSASSLFCYEGGFRAGAMLVGAHGGSGQCYMPVLCDYFLIYNERIVAGALLSDEPMVRQTVKSSDYLRILAIALVIIGVIATVANIKIAGMSFGALLKS